MGLFRVHLRAFLNVRRWDSGGTALIIKEKEPFGGCFGKIKDSCKKLRHSRAKPQIDAASGKVRERACEQ